MKIYDNIKNYFLNAESNYNDYSNRFYIRSIHDDEIDGYKPNKVFLEPHKRDFFEIAVLVSGTKGIQIGGETIYEINNSLAIVSPFQVINYGNKSTSVVDDGYIICFKASFFDTRLNQLYEIQNEFPFFKIHTFPVYNLSKNNFNEILSVAKEIFQESRSNKIYSMEIIKSLLLIFLYKIKRVTDNDQGIVSVNRYDSIMFKFEHAILSSSNNFLSVKEYASILNISPIYLSECIKKASGKSAQKILIEYKIMYAKTLLNQMEKPIAEVAYALNFNEVANFNQFFKRHSGLSPKQYRNK